MQRKPFYQQVDIDIADGDYHEGVLGANATAVQFIATGIGVYTYVGASGLADAAVDALILGDGMPWQPNLNFEIDEGIRTNGSIYFKATAATPGALVHWNIVRGLE